jgi:hypothetical protein
MVSAELKALAGMSGAAADAHLAEMHVRYHDQPFDHVRVHAAWMRLRFSEGRYLRGIGQGLLAYVLAIPVSLLQRHTGLVASRFDRSKQQRR